jgi:hypothetical protein
MPHKKAREYYKQLTGYEYEDHNSRLYVGGLVSKDIEYLFSEVKTKIAILIDIINHYKPELERLETELSVHKDDISELIKGDNKGHYVDESEEINEIETEKVEVEETIGIIVYIISNAEGMINIINTEENLKSLGIIYSSLLGNLMQLDPKSTCHKEMLEKEKVHLQNRLREEKEKLKGLDENSKGRFETELIQDMEYIKKRLIRIESILELIKEE